jgi:hypothetical protein
MLNNFFARLTSRKFLLTVAGIILILVLKSYGVPDNVIAYVVGLIGGYLGVEGFRDIVSVLKAPQ